MPKKKQQQQRNKNKKAGNRKTLSKNRKKSLMNNHKEEISKSFEGLGLLQTGTDQYVFWTEGDPKGIMKVYTVGVFEHDSETGLIIPPKENEKRFKGFYKQTRDGHYGEIDAETGKFKKITLKGRRGEIILIPRNKKNDTMSIQTELNDSF